MTNKRKGGKNEGVSTFADRASIMRASKAWLFLEHVNSSSSCNSIDLKTHANGHSVTTALTAPLSTAVTFFVLNFAQVTCPFFKTVFLNKRKDEGEKCIEEATVSSAGGAGVAVFEAATAKFCLKCSSSDDGVFVASGPTFNEHRDLADLPSDFSCELPAVYLPEHKYWITGLCSVIRYLLVNFGDDRARQLLGHNQTTLSAPAEVSVWTKFCEVDLPAATHKLLKDLVSGPANGRVGKSLAIQLPPELAKYEAHLQQPIRMHNIRKRMQSEKFVGSGGTDDPIIEFARSQHKFAEGPDCLLSDAILFVHYYLIYQEACGGKTQSASFTDLFGRDLPLTCQWFERVFGLMGDVASKHHLMFGSRDSADEPPSPVDKEPPSPVASDNTRQICRALQSTTLESCRRKEEALSSSKDFAFELPVVKNQSLYVSDPSRVNPASRSFTRPGVVESATAWFDSSGIKLMDSSIAPSVFEGDDVTRLVWNDLPDLIHPLHGGQLPPERADKKCHQLENIALAVIGLVKSRPSHRPVTIVDFCSGGGHLAILLAHLLPTSTLIMVENNGESLQRGVERTKKLGLTNCHFFQGNIDYFRGSFDIGVSVHACGVATDLVLKMCVDNRADFVSCPCCYGKLQENHVLSYPRSKLFVDKNPTLENYVVLGHTADQTHFTNDKHLQGAWAMDVIDTDRLHMALEAGYAEVKLTKLEPQDCTPKNNLLIGRFQ